MRSGKNAAASIRQRLLNIARNQKIEFQLVLTRFALERFLSRLSQSKYSNDFVLKGAMLFQVWRGALHRPTRDLDLLSFGEPEVAYFITIIREICGQDLSDDGLIFQTDSIFLESIKEDDKYPGLRANLLATLDTARIPLQVDIGFGDVIIPMPINIDYPSLLDLPKARLMAYSMETVIAEKFHAMVYMGIANSRMKDFYDVWVLATTYPFEAKALRDAIQATFIRRDTPLPGAPPLALTVEFSGDPAKMAQWTAFIRKGRLLSDESLALDRITPIIERFIMPALSAEMNLAWDPGTLEWRM